MLIVLIVWAFGMLNHAKPNAVASTVAAALLAAVGLVDVLRIAIRLNRYAWAKWVGRIALGAVSLCSAWLASVVAEHNIANITKMSPEYYGVSVKLLTGFLTPVVYGGICAVTVVMLAAIAAVVVVSCVGVYMNLQTALAPFKELWFVFSSNSVSTKLRPSLVYRILNGKRPPHGDSKRVMKGGWSLAFVRPWAILLAANAAFSVCNDLAQWDRPNRYHYVSTIVALSDFYGLHACTSAGVLGRVHYIDAENVIIARPWSEGWHFTKAPCTAKTDK
ncbi:hypothetical protein [Pandoraea pnomenusa]|uniref:hypothetical protein n=1 Tax=Pandoraea pnomenusa TaxID=93220 RepID=UPI0011466525|nr:hypothetical protein [Pandoraea pnomenusa]QDH58339.1 hypothetical protein FKQ53_02880 [Pandoraea pnomenusa]